MRETFEESKKLSASPYYERQLITVVPDEVKAAEIEATQRMIEHSASKSKSIDYTEILRNILTPQALIAGFVIQVGIEVIKAVRDLRQKGVGVTTIGSSDSSNLKFPPGHPRKKTLYVGHPAAPDVYFPFSDFHRLMFESKYAEAISLLMALGAKNLSIEHLTGLGTEFVSGLEVPVEQVKVSAKAKATKNKGKSLIFNASLDGCHKPEVPKNLVWYHYEPTWQMVADGRTKYGLKEFNLNVSYKDDFGIGVKLKADVEKAGFEVGSCFQSHEETIWKITGEFSSNGENGGNK